MSDGPKRKASARGKSAALVTLRNVGKTFENGLTALSGVGTAIHDGEFVSVLGASGCGKTTLLRLLAGLIPPSDGTIAWRGGKRPRDIGFVFQEPVLMSWATVEENVRLPLRLRGENTDDTAVEEVLDKVGLTDFADAYPRELSGGMKMRTSIARALIVKPRLLLLDEPFAALDEPARFKLNDELLSIWREAGCTVVFVTHSAFEAAYLSTRILVLSPRPGTIADEIRFLPSTQAADPDYRTSAAFAARARKVATSLSLTSERKP